MTTTTSLYFRNHCVLLELLYKDGNKHAEIFKVVTLKACLLNIENFLGCQ